MLLQAQGPCTCSHFRVCTPAPAILRVPSLAPAGPRQLLQLLCLWFLTRDLPVPAVPQGCACWHMEVLDPGEEQGPGGGWWGGDKWWVPGAAAGGSRALGFWWLCWVWSGCHSPCGHHLPCASWLHSWLGTARLCTSGSAAPAPTPPAPGNCSPWLLKQPRL